MKVILIVAVTVDGKIAKTRNHFPDWTGTEDKKLFKSVTKKAGVMVMGSRTYDVIGKVLPDRKSVVMTRNKKRVSNNDNLVFTDKKPMEIIRELESEGYKEATVIGGAEINTLFAADNLVDELLITYTPHGFGEGLSIFSKAVDLKLSLSHCSPIGENGILARYKVKK